MSTNSEKPDEMEGTEQPFVSHLIELRDRLIRACIARGWAERWFSNPLAPEWLVCRLTDRGAAVAVGAARTHPAGGADGAWRRCAGAQDRGRWPAGRP